MEETVRQFIAELRQSVENGTFVKLTLGNYRGDDDSLQKILARPVETNKGNRILFQYRRKRNSNVANFEAEDAIAHVEKLLTDGFRSGHLFTTVKDLQLTIGKRSAKIAPGRPSFSDPAPTSHDREKTYLVDRNAYYLKALGISTDSGSIRSDAHDKWKQINKFVEILTGLYESSDLREKSVLNVVDMGSGKGYLTFAAYDHLVRTRSRSDRLAVDVTGVESRPYLVELCNQIARAGAYDGLNFVPSTIADFHADEIDILIGLHACDTATDDALYQGIRGGASIIIAAPCCHHEIKAQMRSPELLAGILKHPVMHERTAETITDGIRSLLLEREGYKTKIFEFVSTEHTPKNNMLVATRAKQPVDREKIQHQIDELIREFGIESQKLLACLKLSELTSMPDNWE
ncbi:MAG: SAM-dependent methyltransferase [bacterium]|nr:SAM-dependent methyltransferase [bacterium]